MNITPQQKKTGILVGILLILGGGAFVYLDPLDLDLLGLNPPPPVKKPVRKPPVKAPVKAPQTKPAMPATASAPVAAGTQMAASSPMATSASPSTSPMSPDQSTALSLKQKSTTDSTKQAQTEANNKQEMSMPVVEDKPATDEAKPMANSSGSFATNKTASSKPERPKDQDLRYCLDLPTNAEIAKCAGE